MRVCVCACVRACVHVGGAPAVFPSVYKVCTYVLTIGTAQQSLTASNEHDIVQVPLPPIINLLCCSLPPVLPLIRSELDLTKEQLAHQHARVLSLQQRGAGQEEVCQERLAEQQLRLKQVWKGRRCGGVWSCVA